jgi:predicted transposase YdaD
MRRDSIFFQIFQQSPHLIFDLIPNPPPNPWLHLRLDRSQRNQLPHRRRIGWVAIIDIVTTIVLYKFKTASRAKVEKMLGIELQQSLVYQEAKAEGREEGSEETQRSLTWRMLNNKLGKLSTSIQTRFDSLSLEQIDRLCDALFSFNTIAELTTWLDSHP